MDFVNFLLTKIEWFASILGMIIMFFVGKRMRVINQEAGELDNLDKFREIAKNLVEDQLAVNERLNDALNKSKDLIEQQQRIIDSLEKTIAKYKKKYGDI